MATVIRATPGPIFLACQAQLVHQLGWPLERVLIADPRVVLDHPEADQYLLLWLVDGIPDLPCFEGGGRVDFRVAMRLSVTLRTRYAVDEATSHLAWLTDTGLGHAVALFNIHNALVAYQPTDNYAQDLSGNTGNWLCVEPIKPAPVGRLGIEPKRPEWGESVLGFVATFEAAVDQSRQ
jgi:hypothetical protein